MTTTATDIIQNEPMRSQLATEAAETTMAAYYQQGPHAVLATRRCAALHEAGHAIIFHRTADEHMAPPYRLTIQKMKTPFGPTWCG